jgi:AcrR family transcriptional regulator
MQQVKPRPEKGRLDKDARREAILDVAQQVFLEEGYAAASMSSIAARLGGSKGTLYNYFKSKEELFLAYIRRHCLWQQEVMFALQADEKDVRATLTRMGRAYLANTLTDFALRNFRLIVAEAERSPDIGLAFYDAGPRQGIGRLTAFFGRMHAEGRLDVEDPEAAAYDFLALCQNRLLKGRLCNYIPELTDAQIDAAVQPAVEKFLKLYGPAA